MDWTALKLMLEGIEVERAVQVSKLNSLKKICAIALAVVGMGSYQAAQSATLSASGRVNNVFVADAVFGQNTNNLTLVGVTSLGNCGGFFGFVVFRIKDDLRGQQMFAQILAAASSGRVLSVNVDDAVRDSSGFCFLSGVSFPGT